MYMPTGEHCWKKNSAAQWARTSNLWISSLIRSLLSYVGRYVEWDLNFYCTVIYIATMLHLTAEQRGRPVASLQSSVYPPRHLVSLLVCRGPWMSTVVLYCWCHSDSASDILYFTYYYIKTENNVVDEIVRIICSHLPARTQTYFYIK